MVQPCGTLDYSPQTPEDLGQMGDRLEYQGYMIESVPRQAGPWEPWQLHIIIAFEDHRGVQRREFHSDLFYPIEQDADLHGIAYGQRLIDGKVDGLSVADMKMTDRRATPRFRVRFRATLTLGIPLEGAGVILDLSVGGCRMESPIRLKTAVHLELRIYAPGLEWPLIIEEARVQWANRQIFGLAFLHMRESERQRLDQLIIGLQELGVAA